MKQLPPDNEARQRILTSLETTILVEASAGTGKTTSMVGRMIALLEKGKCEVSGLAAVTFTRKAAAELRSRFQAALEKAALEAGAAERERLAKALRNIESCFVGTIHSFCARILRERPIEAGVDPAFQVIDPDVDSTLRADAWRSHVAALYSRKDPLLSKLEELGLEPGQLRDAFQRFAGHADVEWTAEAVEPLDTRPAEAALKTYLEHIAELLLHLPDESGGDGLISKLRRLFRRARQADRSSNQELMEVLSICEEITPRKDGKSSFTIKNWPGETQAERKLRAQAELSRWNDLATNHAAPLVRNWRARRYAVVLDVLKGGLDGYERRRRDAGGLNNHDLLLKAAELLRGSASIRKYFQRRFTHLLVDEFQDTDPLQAEVMLLLTSSDPERDDWRTSRPRPGSLFVVGDPKQSIYRFRRADMATYNRVREVIVASGGEVVPLTANFRSAPSLIDWINSTFRVLLGEKTTDFQPAYSPLEPGRKGGAPEAAPGLVAFHLPPAASTIEAILAHESGALARHIASELRSAARAKDFLVVTYRKRNLTAYAGALRKLRIPIQITGGSVFSVVDELKLLRSVLRAVTEPHDPVALVAALRGEVFGLSDRELHTFRKAGGEFSYHAPLPRALETTASEAHRKLAKAHDRLRAHASWLRRLPPVPAFERIASDLGLFARAACSDGGNVQAGSLAKAFEVLRAANASLHSASDLVEHLETMLEEDAEVESISALADPEPGVRLMNLHKVKGLEAPCVFLADPTGKVNRERRVEVHIDRSRGTGEGAMCIREARDGDSFREARTLAEPLNWKEKEEEERKFGEAEELRLLYVAATRAGRRLNISFREKSKSSSYWTPFEEHAEGFARFEDAGEQAPLQHGTMTVPQEEFQGLCDAAASRWAEALRPSYRIEAAKARSVPEASRPVAADVAGEGDGAAWGSVIHGLLEAAMRTPDADLLSLARSALAEADGELDPGRAEEAVEVVRSVMGSAVWLRAVSSRTRLVEVPFELVAPLNQGAGDLPTLVRGVMDLVFKEGGGWVIVDYKTDAATKHGLVALVDRYRGQVEAYRQAWRTLTREPVAEAGLYFTRAGTYVALPPAS